MLVVLERLLRRNKVKVNLNKWYEMFCLYDLGEVFPKTKVTQSARQDVTATPQARQGANKVLDET